MHTHDSTMTSRFDTLLDQREAELRALLRAARDDEADGAEGGEVADFKDVASQQSRVTVDEAQADHANHELELIAQARRRLREHRYGLCVDCGDAIDPRRLTALPATPFCTDCQAAHEQHRAVDARA